MTKETQNFVCHECGQKRPVSMISDKDINGYLYCENCVEKQEEDESGDTYFNSDFGDHD